MKYSVSPHTLFTLVVILFIFFFAEAPLPTQRTLPAFHGAQAPGDGGRGEHQFLVHVSSGALLSDPSHRLGGDTEQELFGGEHQDVQRILYAVVGGLSYDLVLDTVGRGNLGNQEGGKGYEEGGEETNRVYYHVILKKKMLSMCRVRFLELRLPNYHNYYYCNFFFFSKNFKHFQMR